MNYFLFVLELLDYFILFYLLFLFVNLWRIDLFLSLPEYDMVDGVLSDN